ncbi:DUF4173 domain-containing protein [Streptosporangium sp. NBC_01755]|uniref:DUF4153 domain-containing protein n=1 Tax=unclassified Streptosporangium TaxID=2632669 RepID=UPI002DDC2A15|nr:MULTISPECIES: DUF4153 domain-containing protein [unclassified Streptosporangium]WSA23993.1 DUF4173 domain-containing protein [Streptosporangium sp. NBC_01810]WSC97931.1 DUF4173 domain-containing protein [Streptosporangium sp. NBC_01755]
MRPLDFLGRIKAKLGMVILLAVVAAFVVNEVGLNAGYSRNVRVAVAVVFALIMVQLLARGMTKPLREMAAAAQTIAKGRYGLRVTATSRDEVGELARAFNAMAADLGEVDRQRRDLVANVSHELRTPITALRAVLENVVDGVSEPDPVTLGTALAQTERLGRLVAQLLDLSRLESGARLIEREDVELRPLCEQALREAVLAREDVTARCQVPEGLSMRADPDLLAQVLANLLDNAVRHSPDGGTVVLAAVARGEGVRLRVSDQGPGIAAEDRARAFERFSRLDAGRTADDGGAGLGLAITKEIVELHGGSIHVEDGLGCHIVTDLPERIEMNPPSPPAKDVSSSGANSFEVNSTAVHGGAPDKAPASKAHTPSVSDKTSAYEVANPVVSTPSAPGKAQVSEAPEDLAASSSAASHASGTPTGAGERHEVTGSAQEQEPHEISGDAQQPDPREAAGIDSGSGEPAGVEKVSGVSGPTVTGEAFGPPRREVTAGEPGRQVVSVPMSAPADSEASTPESDAPAVPPPSPSLPSSPAQPFPPQPVLVRDRRDGDVRREQVVVRNWSGAFLGLFLGGVAGLVCAVIVGIGLAGFDVLLAAFVGAVLFMIGVFVGTVIGATTPTNEIWSAGEPLPHRPPARGPAAQRVTVPEVQEKERAAQPVGARSGSSGAPGGFAPIREEYRTAVQPQGGSGKPGASRVSEGAGGSGGYEAPPLFPRPDLPDTPRWVLPASAAVGLLAAVAVPYSRAGLGLVLVSVAMGAAAIPAVRARITPWSAGMGAIAYGLVATVMFRDADWLVGMLLPAGFLLAALALSGAGRGWLGVLRGGASVLLSLLPVPWFLGARLKGLADRRRVVPLLFGGGLTVVLLAVFGALFASADAVFAEAVQQVFSAQDWAESLPLRILLFVVFAAVVASAVLVGLRPVAEPKAPDLKVTVGRGLWVTPLTALNLLFATFVGMQLTVLFGSTRWVVSATGLTYAEYARSGFFQLVIVSVFVLAIVAVASGTLDLKGFDRWLMAGLLGLLCVLTLVILFSALHRLDLYADAYGLSRLRASVEATVWWLGGVFALVLAAGAARLTGRGHARWLPRTLVLMTSASLLAFAVWNPDLRVAETQIAVRGVDRVDLEYLGDLGAEAVPALDRLPEPSRSCVLLDVIAANDLAGPDPWNGWNLARREARELLARRPVLRNASCSQTLSRLEIPNQD